MFTDFCYFAALKNPYLYNQISPRPCHYYCGAALKNLLINVQNLYYYGAAPKKHKINIETYPTYTNIMLARCSKIPLFACKYHLFRANIIVRAAHNKLKFAFNYLPIWPLLVWRGGQKSFNTLARPIAITILARSNLATSQLLNLQSCAFAATACCLLRAACCCLAGLLSYFFR